MSRDDLGFRVWDCEWKSYRGSGGDEIFMLTPDGELVYWSVRDGKHHSADNSGQHRKARCLSIFIILP